MRRENPKRTLIAEKQLPVDGTKFKSLEELILFIENETQKNMKIS